MADDDNIIGMAIAGILGVVALIFGPQLLGGSNSATTTTTTTNDPTSCKPCQLKGGA